MAHNIELNNDYRSVFYSLKRECVQTFRKLSLRVLFFILKSTDMVETGKMQVRPIILDFIVAAVYRFTLKVCS